jgi:ABC-type cobalamin/Fe3+-siderophores transport system ATPase subunit
LHILQLKNVIAGYNKKAVLSGVSFNAEKAGVYVVLGQMAQVRRLSLGQSQVS